MTNLVKIDQVYYLSRPISLSHISLHILRRRHAMACCLIKMWMKFPCKAPLSFEDAVSRLEQYQLRVVLQDKVKKNAENIS